MSDVKIEGKVFLDTKNFEKNLQKINSKTENFGTKTNKIFSSFGSTFASQMVSANLATMAISKAVDLMVSSLRGAVTEFLILDKNMAKVNTIFDSSTKSLKAFRYELIEVSDKTGIAASDLANASYEALSAGVATEQLTDFIEKATILSQGGFTSITNAVDVLTSTMNAYGKEMYSVEEISDKLAAAQKFGKTTIDEMSRSLYNVIPVASQASISLDDVMASISLITAKGTPTTVATTQIRQAIVELSNESLKAGKIFKELTGKTLPEFVESGGSFSDAMNYMDTYAKISGKSVSTLFGSVEAGQAVMLLGAGGAREYAKYLDNISKSAGEAKIASEKATDYISKKWGDIGNRFKNDINSQSGFFGAINQGLLWTVTQVYNLIDAFGTLTSIIVKSPFQLIGDMAKGLVGVFRERYNEVNGIKKEVPIASEGIPEKEKKGKTEIEIAAEAKAVSEKELENYEKLKKAQLSLKVKYNEKTLEEERNFLENIKSQKEKGLITEEEYQEKFKTFLEQKNLNEKEENIETLRNKLEFLKGKEQFQTEYSKVLAELLKEEENLILSSKNNKKDIRNKETEELKTFKDDLSITDSEYKRKQLEEEIEFFNEQNVLRENFKLTEEEYQKNLANFDLEQELEMSQHKIDELEKLKEYYQTKENMQAEYNEVLQKLKEEELKIIRTKSKQEELENKKELNLKNFFNDTYNSLDAQKENFHKQAYRKAVLEDQNYLKAYSKFASDLLVEKMLAWGEELSWEGIKNIATGAVKAVQVVSNPPLASEGVAQMAKGAGMVALGASMGAAASALNDSVSSYGESEDNKNDRYDSIYNSSEDAEKIVESSEKKTITIYADSDVVTGALWEQIQQYAKDYDNIDLKKG